ncbi:hypothetical protein [Geopsychrobacter electrodiphilus]|uniref:hypothetical protein n=1 Tax=Geopsychrobacter electrodiphilus TaxID=225196 RepID=UPI0003736DCA|nr:hypothetical protein [Geopsychrobacter electrodiphilus]
MTQIRSILLCMLLVFIAIPSFADEMVSLKLGYQSLTPSGTIAGNKNNVGTRIDIEKDNNLGDSKGVTAEVAFQLGNSRLSLGYLPIEFSGTGQMSVSGSYNGQTFSAADTVRSKIKLDLYDIGYTYNLINFDDTPVRFQLGPEVAVKVVDAKIDFVDETTIFNEHDSATVAIPTIGARARVGLSDYLAIVARAGYMEYDKNNFLDAEAQVEFSPLPLVGIYAGYRTFALKIDQTDLFVDVDFSGPFIGALIRF